MDVFLLFTNMYNSKATTPRQQKAPENTSLVIHILHFSEGNNHVQISGIPHTIINYTKTYKKHTKHTKHTKTYQNIISIIKIKSFILIFLVNKANV